MKANLPHALRERRPSRRAHGRRESANAQLASATPRYSDRAVQRVREAGGPVDHASYSCQCGCVFVAPVSTTVSCPHCDAGQVW